MKVNIKKYLVFMLVLAIVFSLTDFGLFFKLSEKVFAAPPSAIPINTWAPNYGGYINAMVAGNDKIYMAGHFGYWGPNNAEAYPVNKTTGALIPNYPTGIFPEVDKIISDGAGGWYIAGYFRSKGASATTFGLMHVFSDGSIDAGFDPQITPGDTTLVEDMVLSGSTLYVVGQFYTIGGATRNEIAALNATTGADTGWDPGPGGVAGRLYAVAVSGNTVYAGGKAYDATTGATLPFNPNVANVRDIKVNGSVVYMGGSFTTAGGKTRNYLAAFDATSGALLPWNPNMSSTVYDMYFDGSNLFVGGSFGGLNGGATIRRGLAKFDTSAAPDNPTLTAWDPNAGLGTQIYGMDSDGTNLYIGGSMNTTIGGQARIGMAALDNNTGLATSWNVGVDGMPRTFAVSGNTVYIGFAGGEGLGGIFNNTEFAVFDPATGQVSFIAGLPDYKFQSVDVMVLDGTTLYIGGTFLDMTINGVTRSYLAAIDTNTWQFTSWNPAADGRVQSIAVKGNRVYVGGNFCNIGNTSLPWLCYLAALDKTTGNSIDSWDPEPDYNYSGYVSSIQVSPDGNTVYVGGNFVEIGDSTGADPTHPGVLRNNIAAIDATTGLATSWDPNADDYVFSILLNGSTLYAGGFFHNIGGAAHAHVAALSTTSNTNNATAFSADTDSGRVDVLALNNGLLYVGGTYGTIGGQPYLGAAAVDATTGAVQAWDVSLGEDAWMGFSGDRPYTILPYGGAIFISGDFHVIGGDLDGSLTNFASITHQPYFAQFGTYTAGGSTPTVEFSSASASALESAGAANLTVSLSAASASDVTVDYTVSGGTATGGGADYTLAAGTATISAGNLSTTIPISIVNDSNVEGDETVLVTLSNPTNADLGANTTMTFTITDDDVAAPPAGSPSSSSGGISGSRHHPIIATTTPVNIPVIAVNNTVSIPPQSINLPPANVPPVKEKTPPVPEPASVPERPAPEVTPVTQTEQTDSGGKTTANSSSGFTALIAPFKDAASAIHTEAESLAERMPGGLIGVQKASDAGASVAVVLAPAAQYAPMIIQAGSGIGSMSDVGMIILKSFYGLMALLGIRTRRKIWGTVYDSRNKQPIDPAIVKLIDAGSGKVVDQAITDLAGRYGFLIRSGTFKIDAAKTHYGFPSKIETGEKDEIFDNLYHGETFQIKNTSTVVVPNIPMDPLQFDWNQEAKLKVLKFHPRLRFIGHLALNIFYYLGFAWAAFVFAAVPSMLNFVILTVYIVVFIIIHFWPGTRLWGSVYNRLTNTSIGGAVLELNHPDLPNVVFGRAKSDVSGKFFLKGEEGHYILSVKRPASGESEEIILGKIGVGIGKEGILNKDILL